MARAELTLLQLCALRNKEREHEDRFAGSFRLCPGCGRYSRFPLPGFSAEWPARLANGCGGSLASSNRTGDFTSCLPPPHRITSSMRLGLVHGGCGLVDLLKSFLLLGDSVPRWLEPDHLAIRRSASFAASDHTGDLVLRLPP